MQEEQCTSHHGGNVILINAFSPVQKPDSGLNDKSRPTSYFKNYLYKYDVVFEQPLELQPNEMCHLHLQAVRDLNSACVRKVWFGLDE